MKQVAAVLILICAGFPWALENLHAAAPMVEKHIFLPEKPVEQKESVSHDALKQSLEFTGVVISDKGRYAFITNKRLRKDETPKRLYQEGEEVAGAVVASITPTHLVLRNNGEDVMVKLYSGGKKRPAPVKAKPLPDIQPQAPKNQTSQDQAAAGSKPAGSQPAPGTQSAQAGASGSDAQPGTGADTDQAREGAGPDEATAPAKASNPFAEALKKAIEKKQQNAGPGSPPPASNPFLEAIKRAQQRQ